MVAHKFKTILFILLVSVLITFLVSIFSSVGVSQYDPGVPQESIVAPIELVMEKTTTITKNIAGVNRNPIIRKDAVGAAVAIWEHKAPGASESVFKISRSQFWGDDFEEPTTIKLPSGNGKKNAELVVANTTNWYYLAWEQERDDGSATVYFAKSVDRGSTFTDASEITDAFSSVQAPSVGVAPAGKIYCSFLGFDNQTDGTYLYFVTSNNGGKTFSEPQLVSDPKAGNCNSSSIFADSTYAYCTWEAGNRIFFSRALHTEGTFDTPKSVDKLDKLTYPNEGPFQVGEPLIFGEGNGILYVLWNDDREGEGNHWIFWVTSSDSGDYFPSGVYPPVNNNSQHDQGLPFLGIAPDGDRYMVFRNGYDIYLRHNQRGEEGFPPEKEILVSYGQRATGGSELIAYDSRCYVVYEEPSSKAGSRRDIIIRKIVEQEMTETSDRDGDGMPDMWEYKYGLNIFGDDSTYDQDEDGFSNIREYRAGTNPIDAKDFPPENDPDYTNVYMVIIIFVVIVILVIFILSSRKPALKTVKTEKQPETQKKSTQRRSKRRDLPPSKEEKVDKSILKLELKEKKTALRLLREEFESKNISKADYTRLKKEYKIRISNIETNLK